VAERIVALHDRNRHNHPPYAYGICKVFVLCRKLGGEFTANTETTESAFFALDELPEVDVAKNTVPQIKMCFDACYDKNWETVFD
jgi:hypothetical protein